ncbi:hypothetical protein Tco_1280133 [Tanacetum coccineum]
MVIMQECCGGQDMAPLPPHDQRHLWLRYQVEEYTKEIVHDFEQRLETIFGRQVNRVHILDFEGLTPDIRQDLAERKRMVYTRDDRQEFFSTCRIRDEMGLDAAGAPRTAEDALTVDEGVQADPSPTQAPQQPPPPPPLVAERSMTDQGRFSTWMITCMTQLMKTSGQTCQAFDGTFQGSSLAAFQRRTRTSMRKEIDEVSEVSII